MNRLYLHMGTPKTGSTAIQYFLHANSDRLREAGYFFPDIHADFPNDTGYAKMDNKESAYANGNFIIDAEVLTAWQQGPEAFDEALRYVFPDLVNYYNEVMGHNETNTDRLVAYIKDKLERSNVILSSENLWTYNYKYLRRFAREFGGRLEAVVYLRRQDRYVESMWNEVIKVGLVSDPVEEYADFMLHEENDNHGLRYRKRLEEICSIIGKEHLQIRLYESGSLKQHGGICQDFLSAVGIDPAQQKWEELKTDVNERISGPAVNIKRVFNEYLLQNTKSMRDILEQIPESIKKAGGIFCRISDAYAGTHPEPDAYLSSSYRKRLEEMFAGDNAYIAREFFGKKEGGPLFADNDWTTERNVEPLTMNEEAMLRFFLLLHQAQVADDKRGQG